MEAEADTPGMSVVGPLHGSRNRLTPSAAPCPSAAWALQGYAGTSQVVLPPCMRLKAFATINSAMHDMGVLVLNILEPTPWQHKAVLIRQA